MYFKLIFFQVLVVFLQLKTYTHSSIIVTLAVHTHGISSSDLLMIATI